MIIVIVLLAIAILAGLGGSIILVLGINSKKNAIIISGGIMLLFTILFCAGAVFCSAKASIDRRHDYMRPPMGIPMPPCIDMPRHHGECGMTISPKGTKQDSVFINAGIKRNIQHQ